MSSPSSLASLFLARLRPGTRAPADSPELHTRLEEVLVRGNPFGALVQSPGEGGGR